MSAGLSIMRSHPVAALALCAGMLSACADMEGRDTAPAAAPFALKGADQKPVRFKSPRVALGVEAFNAGLYQDASKAFNEALRDNPQDAYVHFLNALTYHSMAHQGDVSRRDLAEIGYQQALRFDPNAWWASYGLGVLQMEEGKTRAAQDAFARVLLVDGGNAGALQGLAVASYYAADFPTASAAITQALKARPDDPAILRSAALIAAANGERAAAAAHAERYAAVQPDAAASDFVRRRISEWGAYRGTIGRSGALGWQRYAALMPGVAGPLILSDAMPVGASVQLAQNMVIPLDAKVEPAKPDEKDKDAPAEPVSAAAARPDLPLGKPGPQVVVDVTYIRSQDQLIDNQGINLLHGLQLQYGYASATNHTSLAGITDFQNVTGGAGGLNTLPFAGAITQTLALPTVAYSLNIFNNQVSSSEIVSRPTLIAQQGQPSSFFSGEEVTVGLNGQYGGNLQKLQIGVNVDVTPTLVVDEEVTLRVGVKQTAFEPQNSGSFQQSLQTSSTSVNATVTLGYDQTVILSGLSAHEKDTAIDRTPGLSDLPLLNYLFKDKSTTNAYRTVLIMLTPHRPQAAQLDAAQGAIAPTDGVAELQKQWAHLALTPNLPAVFAHMEGNSLYRQLRAGDLDINAWGSGTTFKEGVRRDLEFLHD